VESKAATLAGAAIADLYNRTDLDTPGAIGDFQFYADHYTNDPAKKSRRQQWVTTLQRGQYPVTPELLKSIAGR
jgi:hypothetical protein